MEPMTPRAGAPLAAMLGILVLAGGFYGTLAGALVGVGELVALPAVVLGVAMACLSRAANPLPAIAAWVAIGLLAGLALRGALGALDAAAWLPAAGEAFSTPDLLADAVWLCVLAALALRGGAPRLSGPMLAAIVATTRIGAFADLPVALLREAWAPSIGMTTFLVFALQVVAGVLAAGVILVGGGWLLARLVRALGRLAPPAILLGGVGFLAALGRFWGLLGSHI